MMHKIVRYSLLLLIVGGLIGVGMSQIAVTQDRVTQVAAISGDDFTWIFAPVKIEDIVMCENGTEAWAVGIGPGPFDDMLLFKITGVDTDSPSVDPDSFIEFPDPFLDGTFPAGMGPRGYPGMAIDSSCSYTYVPNFFLDSVAKIDLSAKELVWPAGYSADNVDEFRTIPSPVDVQLTEDETRLIVSNSSTSQVTILDAETGNTIKTISSRGIGPGGIATFDTFGLALNGEAAPKGADGVSITLLDSFGQAPSYYDVQYTWTADGESISDAQVAYFAQTIEVGVKADGGLSLTIYALGDQRPIQAESPAGANGLHVEVQNVAAPVAMTVDWTKAGTSLEGAQMSATAFDVGVTTSPRAAVVQNSQDLACVDLEANQLDEFAPTISGLGTNPFMVVASHDSSRLYVSNQGSNTVSVLEGLGCEKSVIAEIPVGNAPRHMALSPDNKFLYVSNSIDNTVSVIDTGSLSVVETIQVVAKGEPAPVGMVAINKTGQYLYVFWEGGPKGTPGTFEIRVFDVSGLY